MKAAMVMHNQMKLEIPALPENISFCRVAVAAFASQLDFTLDELEEIKVATSEAVTNAIIHGYQNQPQGTVRITVKIFDDLMEIGVEDEGVGIANVELAMQPAYSTCEDRVGLGFSFMQSFMDRVEVSSAINKGTRVQMVKRRRRNPGEIGMEN